MEIQEIPGGVTAPKGFTAAGVHCGIRKNKSKKDLALVFAEKPCDAAAVYTQNKVKGAPILVTKRHLADGKARAIICNSGNANTCNADGEEKAREMCRLAADALHIAPEDVVVASTGVIGQVLPIEPIRDHVGTLAAHLSVDGADAAEEAIMTTDTRPKQAVVECKLGGKTCRIGGMAKGSGMIHPNMATMLSFVTTDADIDAAMLQKALRAAADKSFNMVTVDGDTSTNDTLAILASGLAGNARITEEDADYLLFEQALENVLIRLARMVAGDGEGATKLLTCVVEGAADEHTARVVAKEVVGSSLVKAAMFGSDANWGRVLCAIGYAPVDVDVKKVDVSFSSVAGKVDVCRRGAGIDFSEDDASSVLMRNEVVIHIALHMGEATATAWGCDLTYDYVKINGDYRT
ncbi:bifunctional glutamate N-acetyltransferase/amino-acid acetyltransferase ArgJ [Ethanoligenens harbinense]|uniref:Arginine biosynthesis bifunctional protein ArgJ n=1 Tax=Ethanoligenens harbinense (strain DSM 18485 / JCM 12961 / CGMCC 1.5033 / YUAN-3) TaxID=663278 RepID=E6U655_ETHHY|nr:bifunctional glutamate N-acetyltransferase/amino-acid acetyltransferase ArgJ [Ethanoligenens harbinense]ADU25734.1 arginine biosynthesis bifunctional protein ArgJ [Ethanoligenens harbinense YUAN-3]AVQ94904.1 bifunctional glutamate N-acetyltransferase/amino-acid acetyltransferase ArgJ [Ethanoligenens harbinense YUAN-3]AYF37596.1 bifunctional glutamate N-acetyltransferase/amino-acid acetyltransferase ArgJ [Ethanoligenens harbinense]AYF40316.1 bifunctional glutamate N-acetyltransferase/amino-ac